MQQHSVPTVVELCRKRVDLHTGSCSNPTDRRQRHVTESVISLVAVIVELFATVEVESNMFRSSLMSKNTPRLRAPLVDTMTDPSTVRLGAANVDCRCLVVTQMHSVLSAFSLSLLDFI